ncbi:sulfite reductase [Dorcoceras hygrometricum]|nr:sulfite reductase [Dorcoceras hygrometricum]
MSRLPPYIGEDKVRVNSVEGFTMGISARSLKFSSKLTLHSVPTKSIRYNQHVTTHQLSIKKSARSPQITLALLKQHGQYQHDTTSGRGIRSYHTIRTSTHYSTAQYYQTSSARTRSAQLEQHTTRLA